MSTRKQRCTSRLGREVILHVPEVDEGLKPGAAHRAVLERFGVEGVEEALGEGLSLSEIARQLRVPFAVFWRWLGRDEERSARVRSARHMSAAAHVQRGLDALLNARSTPAEIGRAREVAQHYRWAAKALAPDLYGDRLEIRERSVTLVEGLRQLEEHRRARAGDPEA